MCSPFGTIRAELTLSIRVGMHDGLDADGCGRGEQTSWFRRLRPKTHEA
jgi:hypothetical protein